VGDHLWTGITTSARIQAHRPTQPEPAQAGMSTGDTPARIRGLAVFADCLTERAG